MPESIKVEVAPADQVTALLYPAEASNAAGITLILGHGAGADQRNAFMVSFATELARRGIDTATFNFLYTEHRRRVPTATSAGGLLSRGDRRGARRYHQPAAANCTGGKSMGSRIASQVAAASPLDLARLVFRLSLIPGKPEQLRSKHLGRIGAPMLFVQGSRDAFGTPEELQPIIRDLGRSAEIFVVEGGDHSFKVPKKIGIPQQQVYNVILDHVAQWLERSARHPK